MKQDGGDIEGAIDVVEQLEPTTYAAVSLAELYSLAERWDDVIELSEGLSDEDDASALLLVFRGRVPLRIVGEVTEWEPPPPERVEEMKGLPRADDSEGDTKISTRRTLGLGREGRSGRLGGGVKLLARALACARVQFGVR